jgi:peptide/nickel transport system substrate-binding protein
VRRKGLITASAVIAGMSLALSACGSSNNEDETNNSNKTTTLTVGWNQPYFSYNGATSNGNATANNNIAYLMNGNFWYYDAAATLQKDETFGTYEKVSDDPLTVKYTVADDLKWSDGTAVDAADMLLTWAAQGGNVNTIDADKVKRDDATGLPKNTKGQVYFDSSSPGLALVTETPVISDDNKSLTLKYDKPFADWQLDMSVTVPAHVTAMKALGITDAQQAKDALVAAIENKDKPSLEKISSFWNTGYDYTSLPSDPALYLSDGAYLMKDFVENQYMTLEKNPDYHGKFEPKIDELTVRWSEDPMAQVQALQNGEISMFSPQVTEDVVNAAKNVPNVDIHAGVEGTYEHFDMVQNNKGPFDPATYGGDAEKANLVRQAFMHGIPRQEIIDKLIKPIQPDAAVRNSFLITAGAPGYDEIAAANGSADYATVDPEKSKSLLQQAGVKTPIDVRVMYAKDNVRREAEFEIYKPALAKAGFNLINARSADWGSKLGDGTYDAAYFGWQSTSTGVSSDQGIYATGEINNLVGYSSKTVDDLFAELVVTTDPAKQLELQTKIEQQLYKDAIGITIFQFPSATMWDKTKVTNVEPGVLAPTMFYGFWNWEVPS